MHQYVGQTTSGAADNIPTADSANTGAQDITSTNYQQQLNQVSNQLNQLSSSTSPSSISPTTMVLIGGGALLLLFLLTRK